MILNAPNINNNSAIIQLCIWINLYGHGHIFEMDNSLIHADFAT